MCHRIKKREKAGFCGNMWELVFGTSMGAAAGEQGGVGIVHLSVSDILIHFSVSVPQTYLTADSWHRRSGGKGGVTADAAFINTWTEQTGDAARREEPLRAVSHRYVIELLEDNWNNYNICIIESCIEDQLDVHQAGADVQCSVGGSRWGFDQLFQGSRLEPSESQTDQRTPLRSTLKHLKQTEKTWKKSSNWFLLFCSIILLKIHFSFLSFDAQLGQCRLSGSSRQHIHNVKGGNKFWTSIG